MLEKSSCVKVQKTYGEKAITFLAKRKLINRKLRIQTVENSIYIPIIGQPSESVLEALEDKVPNCIFSTHTFPEKKASTITYIQLLETKLPSHLLAHLPRAIDFIGDIATIKIPDDCSIYSNIIGEAVMVAHKNVRTVLAKTGAIKGTHRLRDFSLVAGEPKFDTIHKEYGCRYYVDLTKAYFSPRLSYEHNRVSSLVRENETVLDMFTGVGPFSILIAKNHDNVNVYAIDVNPYAINYLKRNIKLNKIEGRIFPALGDARKVVTKRFCGVADRVIMNLPEKASEFISVACQAMKPTGGTIHFYSFIGVSKSLEDVKIGLAAAIEKSGRKMNRILSFRFIRATAPHEWQAVFDVEII